MSDTTQIILAVIGTGITLLGILVSLLVSLFRIQRQDLAAFRQDIDSRYRESRQDMTAFRQELAALRQELRTDIAALHSRIDALYQALFSHKDPAA